MKFHLYTFLLLLMSFQIGLACDCESKSEIDIWDWNRSPLIFTAKLIDFDQEELQTRLKFELVEVYKGSIDEEFLTYELDTNTIQQAINATGPLTKGQQWILFSHLLSDGSTELLQPREAGYCMLSRPILEEDMYVSFAKRTTAKTDEREVTYLSQGEPLARGRLEQGLATGLWKYYPGKDVKTYWEGLYLEGIKQGVWSLVSPDSNGQLLVRTEEHYRSGTLMERITFNNQGQRKTHEFYEESSYKKYTYRKGELSSLRVIDFKSNTTTIEKYENGKIISKEVESGAKF